jgi:hypothetical protein
LHLIQASVDLEQIGVSVTFNAEVVVGAAVIEHHLAGAKLNALDAVSGNAELISTSAECSGIRVAVKGNSGQCSSATVIRQQRTSQRATCKAQQPKVGVSQCADNNPSAVASVADIQQAVSGIGPPLVGVGGAGLCRAAVIADDGGKLAV